MSGWGLDATQQTSCFGTVYFTIIFSEILMYQDEKSICVIPPLNSADCGDCNAGWSSTMRQYLFRSAALFFCLCALLFSPQKVVAQQSLIIDVNIFGVNTNQRNASNQLITACDVLVNDNSPEALDLLRTCQSIIALDQNNPNDIAQLQEILDVFAPEEAFAANDSIVYVSDYQTTNVLARIHSLRTSPTPSDGTNDSELIGLSEGTSSSYLLSDVIAPHTLSGGSAAAGELLSRLGIFFTGQLSSGDVDGAIFEQDADINSSSFTAGADYRFNTNVVAGVGFGVLQNETDFTRVDGGTDSQGFNVTAFASWHEEGQGYFDVVLDVGANSHDLERGIGADAAAPVQALATTDSSAISFTVSAGRYFTVRKWDLGGYLRLSLTNGRIDGYTERASNTNDGSSSIFTFGSQSVKSSKMVGGLEASRVFNTSKAILIPAIRIEYESENENKKDNLEATLVTSNVSASYSGNNRDTSYANLGLGASAVFRNGKSVYAFYETHLQHEFVTQNWLKFGLRLEF